MAALIVLASGCERALPTAAESGLAGEYALLVITYDDGVPGVAPTVRGSLSLTDAEYEFVLEWGTGVNKDGRVDRGVYTARRYAWRQTSYLDAGDAEGVYDFNGAMLVTDLSTAGHRVEAVWRRVSPER